MLQDVTKLKDSVLISLAANPNDPDYDEITEELKKRGYHFDMFTWTKNEQP